MQKKTFFSIGFASFLLVASLLLVKKQSPVATADKNATCCKKMIEGCTDNKSAEKTEPPTDPGEFIPPIYLYSELSLLIFNECSSKKFNFGL